MPKTEIEKETGVSNATRAIWAQAAIGKYDKALKRATYSADLEDDIVDLLADLFHLAETKGFDPDSIYRKSWDHYEYESKLGKEPA
jgi:hypothetical protein